MRINDGVELVLDTVVAGASGTDVLLVLTSSGQIRKLGVASTVISAGGAPTVEGLTVISTTGTQNDVPLPAGGIGYRYTGASPATWTGLVAGTAGQKLTIWNLSADVLKLKQEDVGSVAANRFGSTFDNLDADIKKGAVATVQYSSVTSRWVVISSTRMQ